MNNVIISSLALFLVFVTFTPGSVSSVRILIKKIEMEGWMLKSANISCLAEDIGHHVLQIVSIQLSGPGNVAIASLGYNSTVTLDKDLYFSKIEADGSIQKETWKSHLTIVMTDILSSQTGMYTCEIHYFDQEGFIRDDITSNILDAGEQDTSQVLLYMSSRISTLEDRNADRLQEGVNKELSQAIKDLQEAVKTQSQVNEDLQKAVKTQSQVNEDLQEKGRLQEEVNKDLQEAVRTQNETIKDLQEKDQPCGFSARYDTDDKMVENEMVVFRHVDINIGDGYNPTTGMFTAPRSGLYAFHLTVETYTGKYVDVHIYANDQLVGKVDTRNSDTEDQSSISVTVKLLEGQTVRPVVDSYNRNYLFTSSHYSVFSGYLVQAM